MDADAFAPIEKAAARSIQIGTRMEKASSCPQAFDVSSGPNFTAVLAACRLFEAAN